MANPFVSVSSHMAFGCSHTSNPNLPKKYHWASLLQEQGVRFTKYGQCGCGLLHIISYLSHNYNAEEYKKIEYVILQKPQSFRFPWWRGYDFAEYFKKLNKTHANRGWGAGGWGWLPKKDIYWKSKHKYASLPQKLAKRVAEELLDVDIKMLEYFVRMFPNARLVYYYYWVDHCLALIRRPYLADNDIKLGDIATKYGMDNWGSVMDYKTVNGVYDENGKMVIDMEKLYSGGHILSPVDRHPGKVFQTDLVNRVIQWLK